MLIKHVLLSLPTYLLALIHQPKSIVKDIHKIMSNFFWNDKDGQHKYHWVKLSKLCFLQEEGDIGLRNVDDVAMSFAMKLWWRFRQRGTLWATFMHAKYCNTRHLASIQLSPNSSPTWKRIMEAREHAEPYIQSIEGKGNMDAHCDKSCDASVMPS